MWFYGCGRALLDAVVILIFFQRRATREYYAMDTHEGGAATNLMEFDTAVQRARKEHIECVVQMKKFWQCVYSSKKKGGMMAVFDTAQV